MGVQLHGGPARRPLRAAPRLPVAQHTVARDTDGRLARPRRRAAAPARWAGKDVNLFDGTSGDYLLAQLRRLFPERPKATPALLSRF